MVGRNLSSETIGSEIEAGLGSHQEDSFESLLAQIVPPDDTSYAFAFCRNRLLGKSESYIARSLCSVRIQVLWLAGSWTEER